MTFDLKKTIAQHLDSLARSGVETIATGRGRFELEWDLKQSDESSIEYSTKRSAKPDGVGENKVAMRPGSPSSDLQKPTSGSSATQPPVLSISTVDPYGASLSESDRKSQLQILQNEVAECTCCQQLVASRTQTVFGVGNITPKLVFLGEGPGADEDRLGEPFVGAAGKLLDKIMAASKIKRSDVYILNTVKCRPPANRNPTPAELNNCWGFAQRQLEILQPEFICCLGSVAAKRLLNTTQPLGRLRQRFHQYRASRVLVTYHPAYLLRTESAKRHVWEDMKMLMKEMGVDLG